MNSYSIDASTFAYTLGTNPSSEELTDYIKSIDTIYNVIENQPRNMRYYIFREDLKYLTNSLKYLNVFRKKLKLLENYSSIIAVKTQLSSICDRLICQANNDEKEETRKPLSKYVLFEKWFGINKIKYTSAVKPILPEYIYTKICSEDLKKNLKKHFAMLAGLNELVYKNNENHSIILSDSILSGDEKKYIAVSAEYDMIPKDISDDTKNPCQMKNLPLKNIKIIDKTVKISNIDVLSYKELPISWEHSYKKAGLELKNIVLGVECEEGIKQYVRKIEKVRAFKESSDKEKIDKWMHDFPSVLYANLELLNNFANIMQSIKQPNYFFCNCCDARLRLLGASCSNEYDENKNNTFVKKDRTKKSSENKEEIYWHHLKPYTLPCNDNLSFLTLRIHFRPIANHKKIEIGWIGRHLYLPCNPKRYKHNSPNCQECPLNEDPRFPIDFEEKNRYSNYIAQREEAETEAKPANEETSISIESQEMP